MDESKIATGIVSVSTPGVNLGDDAEARSKGSFPYQCAHALAQQLSSSLTEFPGGHSGYAERPRAFAEALHKALT